ncbi:hypothetical protein Lepto7375DRAFT_7269 [Leptolyngbya sp. PCC 7375]|nr:hypothetical protein Lepto7375DRAFT_7269 [Leptolyngbya sp. PCC 7375]
MTPITITRQETLNVHVVVETYIDGALADSVSPIGHRMDVDYSKKDIPEESMGLLKDSISKFIDDNRKLVTELFERKAEYLKGDDYAHDPERFEWFFGYNVWKASNNDREIWWNIQLPPGEELGKQLTDAAEKANLPKPTISNGKIKFVL